MTTIPAMILTFNISCICGCSYRAQSCSAAAGGKVCAVKLASIKSVLIYIPASHAWAPLQHSAIVFSADPFVKSYICMHHLRSVLLSSFLIHLLCVWECVSTHLLTQVNAMCRGERTSCEHWFSCHHVGHRVELRSPRSTASALT